MDKKIDIKYAINLLNVILFIFLIKIIGLMIAVWFRNYQHSYAIGNTGVTIGVILSAISARSASGILNKGLLIMGLLCTVFFQIWSLVAVSENC